MQNYLKHLYPVYPASSILERSPYALDQTLDRGTIPNPSFQKRLEVYVREYVAVESKKLQRRD